MLMDYVRRLLATKKQQGREKKISKRIEGVLELLTHSGEVPLDKFSQELPWKRKILTVHVNLCKIINVVWGKVCFLTV